MLKSLLYPSNICLCIYIIPCLRGVEFSGEWSNRVAISVYCKPLHAYELRSRQPLNGCVSTIVTVIHNRLKFTSQLMTPYGWRVRGLAWRLSQPSFNPGYGKLICLATLMSSNRTKQICLWMSIYIYIYIYILSSIDIYVFTNLSVQAGYDTRSIFKRSLTGLNLEFCFSLTSCLNKAEEPSLPYYLPIAGGRIIGFIPFPRVLVLCEKQSISSRIWTRVTVSIPLEKLSTNFKIVTKKGLLKEKKKSAK